MIFLSLKVNVIKTFDSFSPSILEAATTLKLTKAGKVPVALPSICQTSFSLFELVVPKKGNRNGEEAEGRPLL